MNLLDNQLLINLFESTGILPIILVVYLLSMVIFWFESYRVKKNRNSIFDQWFLTSIIMFLWGRIAYVIGNWSQFSTDFFILPYEKYGDQIYIFRTMPWKILRIWDGRFYFIPMFIAFLVASYMYVVFYKGWRWREMIYAVFVPANFMLGATLFTFGFFSGGGDGEVVAQGTYIIAFSLLMYLLRIAISFIFNDDLQKKKRGEWFVSGALIIGTVMLHSSIFLNQNITTMERVHIHVLIITGIFMLLALIYDIRKGDTAPPPKSSKTSKGKINLNQAIKVRS